MEVDKFGYTRKGDLGNSRPVKFNEISIKSVDKVTGDLLNAGFIESGPSGSVWDFEPNTVIEDKIRNNGNQKKDYLEYACWLEKNNQKELGDLIKKGGYESNNDLNRQFFGELELARSIEKWRHGFVQILEVSSHHSIEEINHFLNLPVLRFIESLAVSQKNIPELLNFLKKWNGLMNLTKLNIWDYEDCGIGDLNTILPSLKHIKYFYLVGSILEIEEEEIKIRKIDLPELLHFARISPYLTANELQSITQANWPKLEAMTLGTGFDSDITAEDFRALLNNNNLKSLRRLDIRHFSEADDLIHILASSSLLPQLTELSFYQSDLTARGAQTLINNKDRFAHLKKIGIAETVLTKEAEDELINTFSAIKPYNSLREENEIPYIDEIYQEKFLEPDYDDDD